MNPVSLYQQYLPQIDPTDLIDSEKRLKVVVFRQLASQVVRIEDIELMLGQVIALGESQDPRIGVVSRVAEQIISALDRANETVIALQLRSLTQENRWEEADATALQQNPRYQPFAYCTLGLEYLSISDFEGAFRCLGSISTSSINGLQFSQELLAAIVQPQLNTNFV